MGETLETGWLNGILLQMETIEDGFEKSIARYEYPYADGADLEDMGQKARTIKIHCYFWDDGADNTTYDDHKALLDLLQSKDLLELEHPKYGILNVMAEQIGVRHDDRIRTAEVDITLVQQLREDASFVAQSDVTAMAEEAFVNAQDEMMLGVEADIMAALGTEAGSILGRTLDSAQGIVEQFQDLSLVARGYLQTVETFVTGVEAELTTIANPANGLIAAVSYGVNLPGRIIGAVARCAERYSILYDSMKTAPARFFDSVRLGVLDLEDRLGFSKQVRCAFAAQAALSAAEIYKDDEQERQKYRRAEQAKGFDTQGNFIATVTPAPVLTANELEQSLATVRSLLQDGIDLDRGMTSLKDMARALLEHIITIKLEREKIITVELDNAMPLHLVCLKYSLPYNYAERIHSINRIKNPNFTSGEVSVYVR